MQLRPFQRADLEDLFKIDQVCFPRGIAYSKAELKYYLQHPKSVTVIAETASQVIAGFCTGQLQMDQGRCYGHIITIDVLPDARRHGAGRMLLHAVEEQLRAKTADAVQLEVGVDNLHAQAFYQAMGYARVGFIPGYYAENLDAYVLQKQ